MNFDVVTFGSAFVDVYLESGDFKLSRPDKRTKDLAICEVFGGKIKVDRLTITTGGGATNNAVAFERMGLQTAAVCCVGDDDWGLFVRKKLLSEGVSPLYVQISKKSQTSYSTILVTPEGGRTILAFRGASSDLSWHKVEWNKLKPRWFHVSSLGGDFAMLTKIVRAGENKDIKVSFNPGNLELKAGQRLKPFLKYMEVLILNKKEAELVGIRNQESGISKPEKDLKNLGPKIVVITDGRKGSMLWSEKTGIIKQDIYKVKTKEETGAGDAFGAGFVGGLALGRDIQTSLKIAAANSASVVTTIGPKEGLLFAPEVNDWLKKSIG